MTLLYFEIINYFPNAYRGYYLSGNLFRHAIDSCTAAAPLSYDSWFVVRANTVFDSKMIRQQKKIFTFICTEHMVRSGANM